MSFFYTAALNGDSSCDTEGVVCISGTMFVGTPHLWVNDEKGVILFSNSTFVKAEYPPTAHGSYNIKLTFDGIGTADIQTKYAFDIYGIP